MSTMRAVVFDVYKTLLDIQTDEESLDTYLFLSRWLSYHGVIIDAVSLRHRYLDLCCQEICGSAEPFPDFDIGKVFSAILCDGKRLNFDLESKSRELALLFRILTKSISIYPGVHQLLGTLRGKARLGIVSNAQRLFTIPELSRFGLIGYFDAIVLSSDAEVRKPDPKIFHTLLNALAVPPEAAVFVGDNIFDDVYGASCVGMTTIWIRRDSQQVNPNAAGSVRPDYEILDGSYEALTAKLVSML